MSHADRPDRPDRSRADAPVAPYAPLLLSLALHALLLILVAPWLVMRSVPAPQVEVEVMIESEAAEPPTRQPEKAERLRAREVRAPLRVAQRPPVQTPLPRPPQQSIVSEIELPPPSEAVPVRTGQGLAGQSAPAPRETAGLSAPSRPGTGGPAPSAPAAAAGSSATLLQSDGAQAPPRALPSVPSLGSTPQPASRAAALARAGLDRQEGPTALTGPAPQVQSAEPEFRQAARPGGEASLRGGSRSPDDGLAPRQGMLDQTALVASRAAPQSEPGARAAPGGRPAQAAAAGRGSVAAAEIIPPGRLMKSTPAANGPTTTASGRTPAASAGGSSHGGQVPGGQGSSAAAEIAPATRLAQAVPSRNGYGAPASGRTPAASAGGRTPGAQGSVAAAERPASAGLSRQAGSGEGQDASAIRRTAPGGQGNHGPERGSLAAAPGERGSGLMTAAANPDGAGSAVRGSDSGAGAPGEGSGAHGAGAGSAAREMAAPQLLAAGGTPAAAPVGNSGGAAQLSARADAARPAKAVRELRADAMQTEKVRGEARVIEERFNAPALKVSSPRSICELPLMFAGFDRQAIPKGLDSINATAASLPDEIPPRHHPGNQLPRYPFQALGSRAEGRALVRAEILTDGRVGQLWIKQTSGAQALDAAALETVRAWRFHPAQRHGMAVETWIDVPIEYKLP